MSDFDDKPKVSTTRLVLWIAGGAIGLYFVITGLYAALTGNPVP
jgi:hypothetical protein